MNDQGNNDKNLFLAMGLSLVVILGWMYFFPPTIPEPVAETAESTQTDSVAAAPIITTPALTPQEARDTALTRTTRIPIRTARLAGSVALIGARIDDLRLLDYNVRLNDNSEKITLFSPEGAPDAYYAIHGWAPAFGLDYDDVPTAKTPWQVESGTELSVQSPLNLIWDNGKGIIFRRQITIDADYLFTITQSVENNTNSPFALAPYGIIARKGEPDTVGFYILHEGVVRASDGVIEEIDYNDMPDQDLDTVESAHISKIDVASQGWIGFTDKYWMSTLIPAPGQSFTSVSKYSPRSDIYQTDMRLPVMEIPAGERAEVATTLFAGAKKYEIIRSYQDTGVEQFVDSIDWGWFFFLTKPIFLILNFFNGWLGNMGFAIIGLTLFIKTLLFPLAYKSYVSLARMKDLQPEMQKLRDKHGEDRAAMQQELIKLYKAKKVNPAAGCLPILLQIPIFFSLYKVIFVTIEMYHAPFIGWVQDLSAPDPTSFINLFGLMPWGVPSPSSFLVILSIGVYPILMGVTMWLQQKLNPAPTDKTQAQIFAWLPWVFMFMLGQFAAGLILYWVANNTITFIQQYSIMRSQGVKPDILGNITNRKK